MPRPDAEPRRENATGRPRRQDAAAVKPAGCRAAGGLRRLRERHDAAGTAPRRRPRGWPSQRRGCPRFRIQGRGKPGARRSRTAGAGEGEGGEPMPDAEASPLLPDEAPAENSIEGEPLRTKHSGPAGCRASASCLVRRDGSRRTSWSRAARVGGPRDHSAAARSRLSASSRASRSSSVRSAGHPYAANTASSSRLCARSSHVGRSL